MNGKSKKEKGKSIERVIELFYAAIRLIFLVIDAPSGAVPRREGEKITRDPRDRRKVGVAGD